MFAFNSLPLSVPRPAESRPGRCLALTCSATSVIEILQVQCNMTSLKVAIVKDQAGCKPFLGLRGHSPLTRNLGGNALQFYKWETYDPEGRRSVVSFFHRSVDLQLDY